LGPRVTARLRAPDLLELIYPRSRASAPELIAAVQEAGLQIRDITTEEPKLEEVFLSLTGAAGAAARA
jgi:ABC-2 type transport system ATP-binding protein